MSFWDYDDPGPEDEATVLRLPIRDMLQRIGARIWPQRRRLALGILLLLGAVAAELAAPLVLRYVIDKGIPAASENRRFDGLLLAGLLYLLVVGVSSGATYLQSLVATRMGLDLVAQIKQQAFDHIFTLGADYFDHNPPGRLLARVESDSERLQVLFSEVALALLRSLLLLGGTLVVLLLAEPRITLAVVALTLPFFASAILFLRYMRGVYARTRKAFARLSTFVTEYVQAVPLLQIYRRTPWAMEGLRTRNVLTNRLEWRSESLDYTFWSAFMTVEILAIMLILYLGLGDKLGLVMTLGTLVLFVEYTRRLFYPIVMFAEQLHFMQKAFASADRVFGVLETKSNVADPVDAIARIPEDWKEIAFENVTFEYEPAPEGTHPEGEEPEESLEHGGHRGPKRALEQVSFRIRRGERIALVGPSGGGKTTLTNLLLRFYEPTAGRITIDGVDLKRYAQKAWREEIGLVLQDIHLFPGTVGENLRVFHEEVPDEALTRALTALGAVDVVARWPKGLATPVTEGGKNFSMGERQVLSFARALVRDPSLLVLDEATSSVDPVTERAIQVSLERLMAGRTSVVVAHRLSTVTTADRILVFRRARLVEEGTHAELLARNGVYSALFDLQFRMGEVA